MSLYSVPCFSREGLAFLSSLYIPTMSLEACKCCALEQLHNLAQASSLRFNRTGCMGDHGGCAEPSSVHLISALLER